MAKRNIKVTPKSTADRKPKPGRKPKPKPQPQQPVSDPQALPEWEEYQRAIAEGRERKFLKKHKGFRQRAGLPMPPKPGNGRFGNEEAKPSQLINPAQKINAETNRQATLGQNVGSTSSAFGESGGYIGEDGRYHMYSNESDSQRQIREGGEGLTNTGVGLAQENLNNYQAFDWQGSPEERARIEEEVYGRMTRNVDRDYQKEFNDMEQRMYMRGIPLDPSNQAYKDQLDALNEKYGQIEENARSQAVQMGGEEMARSFGVGLGSQQQRMAETAALQKMGLGYQGAPELGFNAAEFNQVDPMAAWSDWRGQNQAYRVGMENAKANMMGAEAAMMNAKKPSGGDDEDPIPTGTE